MPNVALRTAVSLSVTALSAFASSLGTPVTAHVSARAEVRLDEAEMDMMTEDLGSFVIEPSITVSCVFHNMDVDGYPQTQSSEVVDDSYEYGECIENENQTYYVQLDNMTEDLHCGDKVRITIVKTEIPQHRDAEVIPPWITSKANFYKVTHAAVLTSSVETAKANRKKYHIEDDPEALEKEMDVLSMILEYDDAKPQYVSEEDVSVDLWGMPEWPRKRKGRFPGSTSKMMELASNGYIAVQKIRGKVMTVKMHENWSSIKGCPMNDVAMKAKQMAVKQGVEPNKFTFLEFFIPHYPSADCNWGSLSQIGCGHPSLLPNPGGCHAWYRTGGPEIRAHELGHNLGLMHAGGVSYEGGQFIELGDPNAVMGDTYQFSTLPVCSRYQMGALHHKKGEVLVVSDVTKGPVDLGSYDRPVGVFKEYVGISIPCPKCVPKVATHQHKVGGHLWVSFKGRPYKTHNETRTPYIRTDPIAGRFDNEVYVHLARAYKHQRYGGGSEMWKQLGAWESYKPEGFDYTIFVCTVTGDIAKIAIDKTADDAESQCTPPPPTTTPSIPTVTTAPPPHTTAGVRWTPEEPYGGNLGMNKASGWRIVANVTSSGSWNVQSVTFYTIDGELDWHANGCKVVHSAAKTSVNKKNPSKIHLIRPQNGSHSHHKRQALFLGLACEHIVPPVVEVKVVQKGQHWAPRIQVQKRVGAHWKRAGCNTAKKNHVATIPIWWINSAKYPMPFSNQIYMR